MDASDWGATLAVPVTPQRDHIRGPASAPAVLVEYGDYECPYCRAAHAVVRAIETQMDDRVCFVYRHFPLTTVHPHAQLAAEAAEAAGHQRQFWRMHDALFTTEPPLTSHRYAGLASHLGLNLPSFEEELARHVHIPHIRQDLMSGVHSGVNGTPAFYINGVRHSGGWDFDTLMDALNRQLPVAPALAGS